MISVAICTFNGEKYIRQQIDSILCQTMQVDEIVICDDRSSDNTIAIVREIAANNPSIDFHIETNASTLGVRMNFEKALNLCSGDIKFLSDQDDIWLPEKVETIYNFFLSHSDISVVFSNATFVDGNNNPISKYSLFESIGLDEYGLNLYDSGFQLNIFITAARVWGATMAIRKNVICNFDYPTVHYHDYILAIEALLNNSLGYIKTPLMNYRLHESQQGGVGNAYFDPPRINIYDLGHIDMSGYPCPQILQEELNIRDLRYSFFKSGIRGIPKIIFNIGKYKKHYQSHWEKFVKADINRIISHHKANKKKMNTPSWRNTPTV